MGLWSRFRTDERGTTAMLFGLAALPMMGLAGAAIDYSRASMAHARLQSAIDLAALAIVKLPTTASQGEMDKTAKDILESTLGMTFGTRSGAGVMFEAPVVTRNGKTVKVSGSGTSESAFMKLVGVPTTRIATNSTAQWSSKKIEIALVLDNTGSMGEWVGGKRKMDELIAGANRFVNDAKDKAVDNDSIKISIVPFDTQVRVNAAAVSGQDWIRYEGVNARNWKGYFVDRSGTFAASDAAPSGRDGKYPAVKSDSGADLPTVLPLAPVKTDSASMTSKIDAMRPRGLTNIGLGVTWGAATLSAGVPFTEASADARVQRYMVVFTDGKNTAYHKDGTYRQAANPGNPSSRDPVVIDMNAYTLKACGEAKKVATVYTIRLLEGDETMLRSCASTPGHYQNVTQPSDLTGAFKRILEDIVGTRIVS